MIKWISNHTSKDSLFFVQKGGFDPFLLRVFGKRAVFADSAFPFNEDYIVDFTKRLMIYKKSDEFTPSDYACLRKNYAVDYLIMPAKKKFPNYSPVFLDVSWLVYNMKSFSINNNCNKEILYNE